MFKITGLVSIIFDTQTFNNFSKREFVVDVRAGTNLQRIKFECHKDNFALLDDLQPGDLIEVEFYITGREWNGKYFANLVVLGIEFPEGKISSTEDEAKVDEADEDVPF